MKTLLPALLLAIALPAAAQVYRCKDAQGKIALSDRACDASASSTEKLNLPPAERPSQDHIQNKLALQELEAAKSSQECEMWRETLTHNDNYANRTAMRQACGLPEPERRRATVTTCSGQSQQWGQTSTGQVVCVSR